MIKKKRLTNVVFVRVHDFSIFNHAHFLPY